MTLSRAPADIFRERLRAIREQRGYSQDELARRTGLQASAISHFETGTRKPSFENLRRLADALEVTTDYLLGRDDKSSGFSRPEQLFQNYERLKAEDRKVVDRVVRELAKKTKDEK
jgi:transcriptional regulator with XRE-family HTH domain